MNFEDMPELKTEYGYYVVIAVLASMCGVLYFGSSGLLALRLLKP
ncbi:Mg2+ and Co2+ transporter CorA [Rhizobium leguminosarum]|uniref:Mg2+ and Co2+ transporter CorA n=1 Tax=Rhizobium esperanzae TaxID=1967781 RepID=A0A7W6UJG3_9HYPH|nr:Mg2+ and Co2+ transporter CorA [Rhizobium esperanzae]MDH6201017.1 Mg2+ and Co2+ transporter CorA [Rhizobium leguminosarum]